MKTFQWPLRAFLFVGLLQIASCTKNVENVTTDSVTAEVSNDLSFPTTNEFSNCKLRRVVYENPFVGQSTVNMLFTYNAQGNPLSLVKTSGDYNTTNFYFYYDSKKRLTGLLENHDQSNWSEYTLLHRYGYDENNRITSDTLLGLWREPWQELTPRAITLLNYDSQGRIIKENIRDFWSGTTGNPTYTYDVRGNLAVANWKSSWYDNKVSIFRSHPVLQFIHRNYSRNNAVPDPNPFPAMTYNSIGLPLAVRNLNDQFFDAYRTNYPGTQSPLRGIIKAIYDCQ